MDGPIVRVQQHNAHPFEVLVNEAWGTHCYTFATWAGMYCLFPELTLRLKRTRVKKWAGRHLGFENTWLNEHAYGPITSVDATMLVDEYRAERRLRDEFTRWFRFTGGATDDESFFFDFGIRVHGEGEMVIPF